MKLLALLHLAVAASAAAIEAQSKHQFEVTSFAASHTPQSTTASIYFLISAPTAPLPRTTCTASATSSTYNTLAAIPWTPCADTSTSFTFKLLGNSTHKSGFRLELRAQDGEGRLIHGWKHFAEGDVAWFESPQGSGEVWEYLDLGSGGTGFVVGYA